MPDIHLHTARKSTVSRVARDPLIQTTCNTSVYEILQLATDVENEVEEMAIEDLSQTHSQTIIDLLDEMLNELDDDDDYELFEEALREARHEEEREAILNSNNGLMKLLQQQHQEVMNFYQKQFTVDRVDREQQTDAAVQVLQFVSTPKRPSPPSMPARPYASFLTPIRTVGPSLQQLIPCLSTVPAAKMLTHRAAPVSLSHDLVDLTEEDDNNINGNRRRTLIESTSITSVRPLPENLACDHSIARPQLTLFQDATTVRLTWNSTSPGTESVQNYEIYAYKQSAATATWRKIGTVKAMRLPMAVTLKEFQSNSHYAFAIRAMVDQHRLGPFSQPKTIFTGSAK